MPGYQHDPEDDGEEYEDYEVSESEAIALNCLEEFNESSEVGHAVQLQLAAQVVFGKAKGKGTGKSKGKGKGKGKVVGSHFNLQQQHDKLKSLKGMSNCMRCGALSLWAGDPECKFPTSQDGKGKAHLAIMADEDSVPLQEMSCQHAILPKARDPSLRHPLRLLQVRPQDLEGLA